MYLRIAYGERGSDVFFLFTCWVAEEEKETRLLLIDGIVWLLSG